MGQKVHPTSLRLGINENWRSRWFPSKASLADNIVEDYKVRAFFKRKVVFCWY